jgi:hypothetical protein
LKARTWRLLPTYLDQQCMCVMRLRPSAECPAPSVSHKCTLRPSTSALALIQRKPPSVSAYLINYPRTWCTEHCATSPIITNGHRRLAKRALFHDTKLCRLQLYCRGEIFNMEDVNGPVASRQQLPNATRNAVITCGLCPKSFIKRRDYKYVSPLAWLC